MLLSVMQFNNEAAETAGNNPAVLLLNNVQSSVYLFLLKITRNTIENTQSLQNRSLWQSSAGQWTKGVFTCRGSRVGPLVSSSYTHSMNLFFLTIEAPQPPGCCSI